MIVTVVLLVTAEVSITNDAVNSLALAVVVGGTLATEGWLLDSEITAPS